MKLTTNFAPPVRKTIVIAYLISVFASFVGLGAIYNLTLDRQSLLNENAALQKDDRNIIIHSGSAVIREQQNLTQSEIDVVRSRIAYINSVSPIRAVSVNQLLPTIEGVIPEGVVLRRLSYSAIDGQLTIITEAVDAEMIYLFMRNLEKNPMFIAPELQQKPGQGFSVHDLSQYEIHVVVRQP